RERLLALEVGIKSVLDGRPNINKSTGKKALHRLCHQVRRRVAQGIETLGTVRVNPLEIRILLHAPAEIHQPAVEPGRERFSLSAELRRQLSDADAAAHGDGFSAG